MSEEKEGVQANECFQVLCPMLRITSAVIPGRIKITAKAIKPHASGHVHVVSWGQKKSLTILCPHLPVIEVA